MVALDDVALARVVIARDHGRADHSQRGNTCCWSAGSLRLNETAGPAGQSLSIEPRHVSHLRGDDLRRISHPTFLHIERQDPDRSKSPEESAHLVAEFRRGLNGFRPKSSANN